MGAIPVVGSHIGVFIEPATNHGRPVRDATVLHVWSESGQRWIADYELRDAVEGIGDRRRNGFLHADRQHAEAYPEHLAELAGSGSPRPDLVRQFAHQGVHAFPLPEPPYPVRA